MLKGNSWKNNIFVKMCNIYIFYFYVDQSAAASEPSDLDVPASPPNELEKKIIRQMEYYFGDMNLIRDIFLKDQIQQGKDGCILLNLQ